jgi:hypothetical protein
MIVSAGTSRHELCRKFDIDWPGRKILNTKVFSIRATPAVTKRVNRRYVRADVPPLQGNRCWSYMYSTRTTDVAAAIEYRSML